MADSVRIQELSPGGSFVTMCNLQLPITDSQIHSQVPESASEMSVVKICLTQEVEEESNETAGQSDCVTWGECTPVSDIIKRNPILVSVAQLQEPTNNAVSNVEPLIVTTGTPADVIDKKSSKQPKGAHSIPRLPAREYEMPCEWGDCQEVSVGMTKSTKHMTDHIMDYVRSGAPQQVSNGICFTCSWRQCGAQIVGKVIDFNRHMYFHTFHVRLKCVGAHLAQVLKLGACMLGSQSSNWIPEMPNNLQCAWGTCQVVFDNPFIFYHHVSEHTSEFPEGRSVCCYCKWKDCKVSIKERHKLKVHLRSHTQEKSSACPTCGGLFCSHTKLVDHIVRQGQQEGLRYECSHCSRRFVTERMLREHMRRHVNRYKCPLCDMTCASPATLRHHVRFRHSDERPYQCGHCTFCAKTSSDLRKHLDSHNVEDQFGCHMQGCPYTTRTFTNLTRHFRRNHKQPQESSVFKKGKKKNSNDAHYVCHICERKFCRGFSLTYHLKKKHLFQWPPGHNRFRYKMHADGLYRLQTVRYEFLDVTDPDSSQIDCCVENSNAAPQRTRKKLVQTSFVPNSQLSVDGGATSVADMRKRKSSGDNGQRCRKKKKKMSGIESGAEQAVLREGVYDGGTEKVAGDGPPADAAGQCTDPEAGMATGLEIRMGTEAALMWGAESQPRRGTKRSSGPGGKTARRTSKRGGSDRGVSQKVQSATGRDGRKVSRKNNTACGPVTVGLALQLFDSDTASNSNFNVNTSPSCCRQPSSVGIETVGIFKQCRQDEASTLSQPVEDKGVPLATSTSYTRSGSLDECPPEMVDYAWSQRQDTSGERHLEDADSQEDDCVFHRIEEEDSTRQSYHVTSSCPSLHTLPTIHSSMATAESLPSLGSNQSDYSPDPWLPGAHRVSEYTDVADANLHMLGDVALRVTHAKPASGRTGSIPRP